VNSKFYILIFTVHLVIFLVILKRLKSGILTLLLKLTLQNNKKNGFKEAVVYAIRKAINSHYL
jgi:hypothetical protein